MSTITIEEAQTELPKLIAKVAAGEEIVITRDSEPVAKLVAAVVKTPQPVFGRGKGKVVIVAEDDAHLEQFKDYMP